MFYLSQENTETNLPFFTTNILSWRVCFHETLTCPDDITSPTQKIKSNKPKNKELNYPNLFM